MNKAKQKKVLKELKAFIIGELGEYAVEDMQFLTGDEGVQYSEYASEDHPYISFDNIVCDYLHYGCDGWKFHTKFSEFLEKKGLWWEMGHHFDASIYDE